MSNNIGLIAVAATVLASAQFIIELYRPPQTHRRDSFASEPLLHASEDHYSLPSTTFNSRPRTKGKPGNIFIHPIESNLARADMAAQQLGLQGDTDRVKAQTYPPQDDGWELGKGRDVARSLLGGNGRRDSPRRAFQIGDEDADADSDSD